MNSESLRDILSHEQKEVQAQREKLERGESQVISEGHAIEALLVSAGWKILEKDLSLIQDSLTNKLRFGNNLSKAQMDRYIDVINLTEQFRKSPEKYVIRMKMLIKRKVKGV